LVGSVSGTVPYLDDQVVRYDWKYLLSEQVLPDRMASWRESVLAAEAKKAGNASEITRLTPIIIIIKDIYLAQVREGHKCAMSAEMAVWLYYNYNAW